MNYNNLDNMIIKKVFLEDEDYKILDEKTIFDYEIDYIYLDDSSIKIIGDLSFKDIYNDVNNPLVLHNDNIFKNKTLYINPDFYLNNQKFLDDILCTYFKNVKKEEISIYNLGLIKSNIIDAIVSNPNIKKVDLAKYHKDGYTLTKEDYFKFKKANINVDTKYVSDELKDNFDDIILCNSNRSLISFYKYKDLVSGKAVNIHNNLTEEEIENLKYINDDGIIIFHNNDFEHIMFVNNRLKELGKKNNIKIKLEDKIEFNKFIFDNNINDNNIYVQTPDLDEVNLTDYLKFEKILYQMISNTEKLSPFEKYIYAYNLTKQFKIYKENNNNKQESRRLYSILVNEYMVCVGYSRMFGDLLKKMGINNMYLGVSVDTSYDNVSNSKIDFDESKVVTKDGHARRYVHLVDPKYNMDGYYISDPTWDNDLEHDYYNYLALTDEEITHNRRYNWMDSNDIFNVNDINEYINKMKVIRSHYDFDHFKSEVYKIVNVIKEIDLNEYNKLLMKYEYVENNYNWPDNITNLIYDLGEVILGKVNKKIDGNTIYSAIEQVYVNTTDISIEELQEKLEIVRKENEERYNEEFPTRYKIDQSNNEHELENENKFKL